MPTSTFNKYLVTYNVKSVSVTQDSSIGSYPDKTNSNAVVTGLKSTKDWTMQFEVTPAKGKNKTSIRANGFGYPGIDKHPGHVEGKGWKYNVDLGTGSVDRLVVSNTSATLANEKIDDEKKKISLDVAITCNAKILLNTH